MTLRLGGDGAITGCTSLEEPTISISGLTMTTPIEAVSGTAAAPSYTFSGDTDNGLYYGGTNSIGVSTAGTNAIIVDASQRVLVATTTSMQTASKLQISRVNGNGIITIGRDDNTVSAGNGIGAIDFHGNAGGTYEQCARILAIAEDTHALGDKATGLAFYTNGGSSSATERMRIDSSGNILIRTSTDWANSKANNIVIGLNSSSSAAGISLGSTTECQIAFGDSGDSRAGLIHYQHSDNSMRFYTNGPTNERIRIDSSGRLLVGTSSARTVGSTTFPLSLYESTSHTILAVVANHPAGGTLCLGGTGGSSVGSNTLVSNGQTIGGIRFAAADGADLNSDCARIFAQIDGTPGADNMPGRVVFSTTAAGSSSPAERMRLDSSGQLLIGRTSVDATCRIGMGYGSNTAGTYIEAGRTNRNGNGLNKLFLFRHGYWAGSQEVASIGVLTTSSTAGSGHGYGNLVFYTGEGGNGDSGSTSTERMRISSGGVVSLVQNQARFALSTQNGMAVPLTIQNSGNNTSATLVQFTGWNGSVIGSISGFVNQTTYATSSDYRLKENVIDLTNATDRLKQLRPKRFNFIENPDLILDGFLAHEAQQVVSNAVTGEHNEIDQDGNPVYQGIDQSKLVPLLTAALQEAIAKIETLETKVAVLEAS